jgi:hypothetical protein
MAVVKIDGDHPRPISELYTAGTQEGDGVVYAYLPTITNFGT